MLGNEPAFPAKRWEKIVHGETSHATEVDYPGMTIRQYFVAQAMAGLLSGPSRPNNEENTRGIKFIDWISEYSTMIADACLEREADTRKP